MDVDSSPPLVVEEDGAVVRLTLARPERLNALDEELRRRLEAVFDELDERPELRVVVIRGAGRAFSAGANLRRTAYPPVEGDWSTRRHRTATCQRLLAHMDRLDQTVVVGLHGHVVGGAGLLAAACDIRIGDRSAVLRIPELAIGIPLTWAGVPLLVREVGLPRARDWVMTCRAVEIDELYMSGFVQRVVPVGDLDAAVETCVEELLAIPPAPLAITRSMMSALGRQHPAMVAAWADADLQQWAFTEDEYRSAASAYVNARQPRPIPPADATDRAGDTRSTGGGGGR